MRKIAHKLFPKAIGVLKFFNFFNFFAGPCRNIQIHFTKNIGAHFQISIFYFGFERVNGFINNLHLTVEKSLNKNVNDEISNCKAEPEKEDQQSKIEISLDEECKNKIDKG